MTIWVSGRLWRQLGIVRESEKGGGKQAAWRPISESDEIIAIAQYVYSKGLAYIVRRKERIKGSDTRKIRKLVNYVHPSNEGNVGWVSGDCVQGGVSGEVRMVVFGGGREVLQRHGYTQ